jgi:hypothetical protein
MELSDMLNRFAHSIDDPEARIETNELLGQLVILVQRFATLKEVKLIHNTVEAPLELRTDPFRLQLIIVACLETCFDHLTAGGKVTIQARRGKEGIAIQCLMEPDGKSMEDMRELSHVLAGFQPVLHHLNAKILPIKSSGQPGLELILSVNNE